MAEYKTIARPYAKACFEIALQSHALVKWEIFLSAAAYVTSEPEVRHMLFNPASVPEKMAQFFIEVCKAYVFDEAQAFIQLLASNKRLLLLSDIKDLFLQYKAQHEQMVEVNIFSPYPLSEEDKSTLSKVLEKRLQKKVNLNYEVDENLIGGLVIKAGDWVVDGSIRGKLKQLAHNLLA